MLAFALQGIAQIPGLSSGDPAPLDVPDDPLGRNTPRGTIIDLSRAVERDESPRRRSIYSSTCRSSARSLAMRRTAAAGTPGRTHGKGGTARRRHGRRADPGGRGEQDRAGGATQFLWPPCARMLRRMSGVDTAISIALGVGLAAAVGFRIFLPLLIASIAAYTGHLRLDENFAWLGSVTAITMLSVAAVVEVLAYYIPTVDNLLDSITTPLALVAGTVVSAAVIADLPPLIKWSTAIIAGGGVAAITQGVTTLVRAKSTAFTAGIGNPVVSTVEMFAAVIVALLALLAPLVALALVVAVCWITVRLVRRFLRNAPQEPRAPTPTP
jgi:hypothetical protein